MNGCRCVLRDLPCRLPRIESASGQYKWLQNCY